MRLSQINVALALGLASAAVPPYASAQEVRGRIIGAASETPVTGAFVILLDSAGGTAAATLSNETGQYALRARRPGTYTIRVERLALDPHITEPLSLAVGGLVRQDIIVTENALTLAAVNVTGQRQGCRSFGDLDDETGALWEEARKALSVAAWTAAQAPVNLHIVQSLTEREAGSRRIMFVVADSTSREMRGSPWNSAPAVTLVRLGFVRQHQGGYLYFGPDAEVLLSDVFLASHCFRVVQHPDTAGLVGLDFRPRGNSRVTEVRGTLWLHRESAELRGIDYEYVRLPYRLTNERVGGSARYQRLGSGMWILSEWTMTTPRPATNVQGRAGARQRLLMSRHSARVVSVTHRDGELLYSAPGWVSATGAGRQESAGDAGPARPSDVPIPGSSMPARLWAAQRCGGAPEEGRMHVIGSVIDAERRPTDRATVKLTTLMPGYFEDRSTTPDVAGLYWFCNAPAGQPYRVEITAPDHEDVAQEAVGAESGVANHRFRLTRS